jgi:hypothetical protein
MTSTGIRALKVRAFQVPAALMISFPVLETYLRIFLVSVPEGVQGVEPEEDRIFDMI